MSWKNIMNHFGYGWTLKSVWYRLDWTTMNPKSIKKYLQWNTGLINDGHVKIPWLKGTRDEVSLQAFKWVVNNIQYQRDIDKFGVIEKWENIDNILETKLADCESMSTLLYCIMRAHGINPLQLKLVAGTVKTSKGLEGHAWLEYQSDVDFVWHILDPAYDPKNQASFRYRIPANQDSKYKERWFSVTDLEFV